MPSKGASSDDKDLHARMATRFVCLFAGDQRPWPASCHSQDESKTMQARPVITQILPARLYSLSWYPVARSLIFGERPARRGCSSITAQKDK